MSFLQNFKIINGKILDTPIYRVFSLDKFLISLNQNSLHLVKPSLWDDPYEGFLLNQNFWSKKKKGLYYEFEDFYRERYFGQCWTFRNEADFLWRIYAPNKDGIMVKSSIRRFYEKFNTMPDGNLYLGKVKYMSKEDIEKKFSKIKIEKNYEKLIIDSLLIKRKEFSEEKEIRLLFYSENFVPKQSAPIVLGYDKAKESLCDLLFEEVIVDPRIDKNRFNYLKKIIKDLGFNGIIKRSEMYDIPNLSIEIKENNLI